MYFNAVSFCADDRFGEPHAAAERLEVIISEFNILYYLAGCADYLDLQGVHNPTQKILCNRAADTN